MSKKSGRRDIDKLRKTAEVKLANRTPPNAASARPAEELLHELQVYQIELEMQNEALRQSQLELEESLDRYVDLYEFAPVGYLTVTRAGMISEINLTGAKLLGMERKKLLRRRFDSFVVPDQRDRWRRLFTDIFQQKGVKNSELALENADGKCLQVHLDCLYLAKEGALPVVHIMLTDITNLKRVEDELRESERLFSSLISASSQSIWHYRPGGLPIQQINQASAAWWREFTGQSEARRMADGGMGWLDAVHEEDREAAQRGWLNILAMSEPTMIEYRVRRWDGEWRWLEVSGVPIRDGQGTITEYAGTVKDITERKQAEAEKEVKKAEAMEARALLQTVLDSTPDWVFAKDESYRFLFVNRAFAAAQGYAPEDMIGRPDTDFWSDDLCNGDPAHGIRGFHADDDAAMAGNLTHNPNDPATLANGELRIFDTLKMPLRDTGGRCYGVLAYARDVTDRKSVERRLRELTAHIQNVREEEKASIAREIHDDLGGTLTALKMEIYWLAEELSANEAGAPLLKHVELMAQLTDNAVNVTRRIITGLRPTILDDLGLLAALEWQAEQFRKQTGIECLVNSIEDKVKLGRRHSIALFRIYQEALTNIVRHSGASRVEVEFYCNDKEVQLSVSDNGRGLPDGHIVAPTSYGMRGMCERVEQLGGKIKFDSPPGGGFNVTVILPLHADSRKEVRA